MEQIVITLQDQEGKQQQALLEIDRAEQVQLSLSLELETEPSIIVTAGDYFNALARLREQLAADGLLPVLKGAQVNVYPSRMSFQMGLGRMAYEMELGKATSAPPVDIFAPGDPDKIASVGEQEAFFEKWLEGF